MKITKIIPSEVIDKKVPLNEESKQPPKARKAQTQNKTEGRKAKKKAGRKKKVSKRKGQKDNGKGVATVLTGELLPHAGYPTKYREEYIGMLEEYFDIPSGNVIINSDADNVYLPNIFPTKGGFADKIKVHSDTVYEWAHAMDPDGSLKHPEFSVTYKRMADAQQRIIIENGLMGVYPSNFAIFICRSVLGLNDRTEGKLPGEGDPPIPLEQDDIEAAKRIIFLLHKAKPKTKQKRGKAK